MIRSWSWPIFDGQLGTIDDGYPYPGGNLNNGYSLTTKNSWLSIKSMNTVITPTDIVLYLHTIVLLFVLPDGDGRILTLNKREYMTDWIVLVLSLPTENATVRMRAWRALKAAGVGVLRDGVYLLPYQENSIQLFESIKADIQVSSGTATILRVADDADAGFPILFDRGVEYGQLREELSKLQAIFSNETLPNLIKQLRKLRKTFAGIAAIDYFPGEALRQTETALVAAEVQLNRLLSPNEPHSIAAHTQRLDTSHYQGRNWATRRRPWVDRLASAWLIRRFIDKRAQFLWLDSPDECPANALGFDFDGAAFTHVGTSVTFEVLLASFGLEQAALLRLGKVVHYLDAGGVQPAEASGLEQILWGLRNTLSDDDQLLTAACAVFDALLTAFTEKV